MFFIHKHEVPQCVKVTYSNIVCNIHPQKKDKHIVRLTVGIYKLIFDKPVSAPTSNLTASKIHWNSFILTLGAKYLVIDANNFDLNNLASKHEYYKIALSLIPQEVIDKYNLMDNKINGIFYDRVEKGMYGIVQVVIIAHTAL